MMDRCICDACIMIPTGFKRVCKEDEVTDLMMFKHRVHWTNMVVDSNGLRYVLISPKKLRSLENIEEDVRMQLLARVSMAAVPSEWRASKLLYKFDCTDISQLVNIEKDVQEELMQFTAYKEAPPGLRDIFQVHPITVLRAAKGRLETLYVVKKVNPHMYSYELAALFIWWALLPDDIYQHFLEAKLHMVNLAEHHKELAQKLEIVRQQGTACGCGVGSRMFQFLRKFMNLRGRGIGEADLDEEKARAHPFYSYRTLRNPSTGNYSRKYYLHRVKHHLRVIISAVINKMVKNGVESMEEFWQSRHMNTPSGSSSNRHVLDKYAVMEPKITKKDRPNKKSVFEALPDHYIYLILGTLPRAIARQSTKHEPGFKQRALYASDDESTVIASYASHRFEKNMSMQGMCPLQRPVDVKNWWLVSENTYRPSVWLSTDFSDFNKEHSAEELELVNLVCAEEWLANFSIDKNCYAKAVCAMWVSKSIRNRIIKYSDGTEVRSLGALWSGTRDTARDNTLLHYVYHNIICDFVEQFDDEWVRPSNVHMCGDDEDVVFSSALDACLYYEALKHLGWHANDKKQLCGYRLHEFLQKMPDKMAGCIGPLSSMVAALASGQWYTTPGYQQDTAVNALSTQLWEFVVRGADMERLYVLACEVVNAYMKLPSFENIEAKKLEWWKYRLALCNVPVHYTMQYNKDVNAAGMLWYYPGIQSVDTNVQSFYESQEVVALPSHASNAWARRWYHKFVKYGVIDEYPRYVRELVAASYGPYYHTHLQKSKLKWLHDQFQNRVSDWSDRLATVDARVKYHYELYSRFRKEYEEILYCLKAEALVKEPLTLEEKLARKNMDPLCFQLLGGTDNQELCIEMELYKERHTSQVSWADILKEDAVLAMFIDPALRSFIRTTGPTA